MERMRCRGKFGLMGVIVIALAVGLSSCSTPQSRIERNPALYHSLPAATQAKVKEGKVAIGFTPEMVFLAWGDPDRKREVVDAKGKQTVWIYLGVGQEFDGYDYVQVPRYLNNGHAVMCLEQYPRYRTVYYERASVTFINGKVTRFTQ